MTGLQACQQEALGGDAVSPGDDTDLVTARHDRVADLCGTGRTSSSLMSAAFPKDRPGDPGHLAWCPKGRSIPTMGSP
jgi:hypothetical protein